MRERRLILHDWEARIWERIGLILRPIKHRVEIVPVNMQGIVKYKHVVHGKPPFQPGDLLWGAVAYHMTGRAVRFRADYPSLCVSWNTPQQMPRELARLFAACVSCKAVKLSEFTHAQYEMAGRCTGPYGVIERWAIDYGSRYSWETSWAWAIEVKHE